MRKVAFLHASVKLKNARNMPSLILEKVPLGSFSRVRQFEREQEEVLLAGIIQDLACSEELDEIVVVTSVAACDDAIAHVCARCNNLSVTVTCHRITDAKTYAFVRRNRVAKTNEWPYVWQPMYGAWHIEGFFALAEQYHADVVLCLQAEATLLINIPEIDRLLSIYTMKGLMGVMSYPIQTEFALLNRGFMSELAKKYHKKVKGLYEQRGDTSVLRIDYYIQSYTQDAKRSDMFYQCGDKGVLLHSCYGASDLQRMINIALADFAVIDQKLAEGQLFPDINMPLFVDVCCAENHGQVLSLDAFKKIIDEISSSVHAVNMYYEGDFPVDSIAYCQFAYERVGMVMIEFESNMINENVEKIREMTCYSSLVQLNIMPEVDVEKLTALLHDIRSMGDAVRPLCVLKISPAHVEKYSSFSALVDKIVIKSHGSAQSKDGYIDFTPFDRFACKKVTTSLFYDSDMRVAPCRFMKPFSDPMHSVNEGFNSDSMEGIRNAHQTGDLTAYANCRRCKEWYTADVPAMVPISFYVNENIEIVVPQSMLQNKEQCISTFHMLVRITQAMLAYITAIRPMPQYSVIMHEIWRAFEHFNRLFYQVGDALFSYEEYDMVLDAWEKVLKFDPSNKQIHDRLDAILLEQQ